MRALTSYGHGGISTHQSALVALGRTATSVFRDFDGHLRACGAPAPHF